MKVLFLSGAHSPYWIGGGSRVACILRSALSERGMDIHSAWFPHDGVNTPSVNMFTNNAHANMFAVNSEIVRLYRCFIQKNQPNVVITDYDIDLSAFWASVLSGVPTIAQAMSPWPVCPKADLFIPTQHTRCEGPNFTCGQCIARKIEDPRIRVFSSSLAAQVPFSVLSAIELRKFRITRSKLSCASAIVSCDTFLKNKMAQFGYDPEKIHVIYNGVDLNKTKPVSNGRREKIVLFLAYQTTKHTRAIKGCDHFVQLARKLKPEFPDVRFLWIGQQQIKGDSFETKPYIRNEQDLQEAFRSSYLLLLPSLWPETMSYSAQEAMAYGKPVVAYDTGANSETIIHSETGLLADWGNIDQLTSHVRSLLLDEKEAKRMGNNARKVAVAKFGIDQTADEYMRLIERVAQASTGSQ